MLTAHHVLAPGEWSGPVCDHISLDFDERHRRRFHYVAAHGTEFLLDLPRATVLRQGDALKLSDGRLVQVLAASEALMEVAGGPHVSLLRLAWHIGNRHLPAEILADRILLREDHVIRAMLEGLGGHVHSVIAPFTPEQGAYAGGGHGHHDAHRHDDGVHHHAH